MSAKDKTPEQRAAERFHNAPGGGFDFGAIAPDDAAACGAAAGPIRLQDGFPGNKGWGNQHVHSYPDRMKQLASLGYSSFVAYAFAVAQNYQQIGDAGGGRLALIWREQAHDLQVIIQYRPEGFWSIITGLPYRVARCQILRKATRTSACEGH